MVVKGGMTVTAIKMQAMEMLQDIPDDKFAPILEIIKGLRSLFVHSEDAVVQSGNTTPVGMGVFSKYANPALIPLEKEAWGIAMKEKHAKY